MKAEIKIVFLIPGFPKDENDSTCLPYLQNYFRALTKIVQREEIYIIAFQYPYEKIHYTWEGMKVFSAGGRNRAHLFRLYNWWLVFKQAIAILRMYDVQLIHSFWIGEASLLGFWLARMFHIRQVVTIMGQDALKKNWMHFLVDFKKVQLAGVSPFTTECFNKQLSIQQNVPAIPWGIDRDEILKQGNGQSRHIDILGVGSLTLLKNYDLFLDCVMELKNKLTALKVVLIGEGEEYDRLLMKIQRWGLEDTVELLGSLPRIEVIKYMWKSKILLHTSSYESQGYVFMESLQCGMHTVSFKVGYIPSCEKSFICKAKEEIVSTLLKLLSSRLTFEPACVKPMEETVHEYADLYFQSSIK